MTRLNYGLLNKTRHGTQRLDIGSPKADQLEEHVGNDGPMTGSQKQINSVSHIEALIRCIWRPRFSDRPFEEKVRLLRELQGLHLKLTGDMGSYVLGKTYRKAERTLASWMHLLGK